LEGENAESQTRIAHAADMKPKFQADADLNEEIVTGVLRRTPEIDFQTATEAGLQGVKDENVLEIASLEERILVSHDRKTMPKYFAEFISQNQSAGIIIVSKKLEISLVSPSQNPER
jgi:predicted nuclease of predicted toxin-antitoxin system